MRPEIKLHDWAAGRILREFRFGSVRGLALHPDGQHLAAVNGNGTIYILRLPYQAAYAKKQLIRRGSVLVIRELLRIACPAHPQIDMHKIRWNLPPAASVVIA